MTAGDSIPDRQFSKEVVSPAAGGAADRRCSAPSRSRRRTGIAVVALLTIWAVGLWYRTEIRSHFWAWRITRVESPDRRKHYAACLGAVGDPALSALPRLLDDPRASIRLIGVRGLRTCRDKAALPMLLARLRDPDPEVCEAAALEIALRDDRLDALPALAGRLNGPAEFAIPAIVAVERIGGPQAEQVLMRRLLQAAEPDVAAQAIDSLGVLGCTAAAPLIREHLADQRPILRPPASQRRVAQAVAAVSGSLVQRGVDPQAVLAASRTDLTVAAVAQRALALLGTPPATRPASAAAR